MIKNRKFEVNSLSLTDVIVFALLAGLITTLIAGYSIDANHPIEQIPIILRTVDESYLTNDFFVNTYTGFGPRFFYAQLMAFLSRFIPLYSVYFMLTILTNSLVALISGLVARNIFGGSNLAGILAAGLVMSATTFSLGSGTDIYATSLNPARLVMPILLLSLWAAFNRRPLICGILAGIASLIHPTFGLETGALALAMLATVYLLVGRNTPSSESKKATLAKILAAFFILFLFAAVSAVPYLSQEQIEADQFIYLVAYLRHPHHDIPSTFAPQDFLNALFFLIATGIAWYCWQKKSETPRHLAIAVPVLIFIVAILCIGGYLFVEIMPSRLWTIARTFRLPFLVKWLGLILVAGALAVLIQGLDEKKNRFDVPLILISFLTPVTMGITHALKMIRDHVEQYIPHWSLLISFLLTALLVAVYLLFVSPPGGRRILLFSILVFMAFCLAIFTNKGISRLIVISIAAILSVLLLTDGILPTRWEAYVDRFRPVITPADLASDEIDIASYVRDQTPENAIFLTPPVFGKFRFMAERAIVVDFVVFPYQDQAMLEWQQRLFDSYGKPNTGGWTAAAELDDNYRRIDDQKTWDLRSKYDVSYAVLYQETKTSLPILYENPTYKLVKIDEESITQVD